MDRERQGQRQTERDRCLTSEQIPQVVGFDGLLLSPPAGFPVADLVAGDEAILRVGRRRLPAHFNTLKAMKKRNCMKNGINLLLCISVLKRVTDKKEEDSNKPSIKTRTDV